MAYHCLSTDAINSYTDALDFVSTSLQTIGWTLYDDVSSTEKVFTSTGENGKFVNAYVRLYVSTYLRLEGYMWWNNSTHTGTGKTYSNNTYNYIMVENGKLLTVRGDKNEIVLWAAISNGNYATKFFGFLTPFIEGYTTASGISSGSNITVDVDSTEDLLVNAYAMIIGTETEGRDPVYIDEVVSDTQIKLTSTPRSYAAGAKIGHYPCPFITSTYRFGIDEMYFQYLCGYKSVGTTSSTPYNNCYCSYRGMLLDTNSYNDPDEFIDRHILQSCTYGDAATPHYFIGYLNHLKRAPLTSTASSYYDQDLYCIDQKDPWIGVPTSTTSSGIVDVGHNWDIDQFKDKIIVITSGPGEGETRNILSNTADTLNIVTLWDTDPTNASTYEIHDGVYRNIFLFLCIKEIII